ncbi:hypothetical protein K431DRAFT_258590 [Polychaeton citri CBS 116435]|uniref:Uncharacterized protein n=1 Tax=Polychaeton citri CBS 116435 TaxID=1314669 RepID=A0A9P4PVV5_9PEZI|nr:hypothetical protein K431DRAFT_258590 [Polychaeton citri CBS 116435]
MIRPMWINVIFYLLVASANSVPLTDSILLQYPPGTWVENLALTSIGDVLPIATTSSVLSQLDPTTGHLRKLYDFHKAGNAIQSISSITPDMFAVCVLTCNLTALSCTPGSASVWLVDLRQDISWGETNRVKVSRITALPKAVMVNGVAGLASGQSLVIADSGLGGIWQVDLATSTVNLAFVDESMMPTADIPTGINGIRVRGNHLYFTNSAKGTFNRIAIDPHTGYRIGVAEVISSNLTGPDDFEIDDQQNYAYICNGAANQLIRQPLSGGKSEVVASLPGPTSVRWLNDRRDRYRRYQELYASTVGGLSQYVLHNVTIGGAIYKITLNRN